jgi:excisionase family DNA binding protein
MDAKPTTQPLAYSVAEATRAIGIGRSLFYLELAAGRVKAKRLGRRVLIEATELERYLASLPDARSLGNAV